MSDPEGPEPQVPATASDADVDGAADLPPRPRRSDARRRGGRRRRRRAVQARVPVPSEVPDDDLGTGQVAGPGEDPASDEQRPLPGRRTGRRRAAGRRAAATRRRRRRARLRTILGVVLLSLVAATAITVASLGFDRARELVAPTDDVAAPPVIAPGDRQPALALVTYDESSGDTASAAVVVLAYDREADQGTVLLVPGGTVADVPGHGSFTVRDAYTFGEGPLVAVTIDNLLDVRLDGVITVSREGWAALGDALGPIDVDVRSRLVAPAAGGGGEVRFEPGVQRLAGDRLAEYLTLEADGETELDALPRIQQVIAGLLDRVAGDPGPLQTVLGVGADGRLLDTEVGAGDGDDILRAADPELVHALFTELADARQRERVTTLTLPVSPLGTGRDDLYRVDASRADQLIDERLSASRPTEATGAGRTLQVLNGNGIPGIGQQIAEELQPGGYRILLTGNADSFDHEVTRIVVYDDSAEQLAIARDIRDRLGAGEIERSGTPQSVVDVTIVVGADFPPD